MPSIHHPLVPYSRHNIVYIRNLLLGFSTYIVLCGLKTRQIMSQAAAEKPKGTRTHWAFSEVVEMLSYLISQKSRMLPGQMLPAQVILEVQGRFNDPKKNFITISSKFTTVRRDTCFVQVRDNLNH